MRHIGNPAMAALVILVAAGAPLGVLARAPNRLLSGHAIVLWHAMDRRALAILVLLWLGFAFFAIRPPTRSSRYFSLGAASAALLLLCWGAGHEAANLATRAPHATRILLGGGFWVMVFGLCLMIVDALEGLRAAALLRFCSVAGLAICLAALGFSGVFDALSLAREYATHRVIFNHAFSQHVELVGATLVFALSLGVPTGIALHISPGLRRPVFSTLNVIQTIPSVALFGLLITPLSAIGLSGIGAVPAIIALTSYGVLPVVRNVVAGLDGVENAVLEAAGGMGMSEKQILQRIKIPLAAPALLAGLRIVTVQTIGLAVVAALIGAGGLGDFVFQGLGQYAVDLVLLGALPAIGLALTADFLLRLAGQPTKAKSA